MQSHTQHFSEADTDNILCTESTNQPDFNTGKLITHSTARITKKYLQQLCYMKSLVASQQMLSSADSTAAFRLFLEIPNECSCLLHRPGARPRPKRLPRSRSARL